MCRKCTFALCIRYPDILHAKLIFLKGFYVYIVLVKVFSHIKYFIHVNALYFREKMLLASAHFGRGQRCLHGYFLLLKFKKG